jgi:hypothetical protein
MVIILTFKISACSRLNSKMLLFRGQLLSNQDIPDIERKHGQKNFVNHILKEMVKVL